MIHFIRSSLILSRLETPTEERRRLSSIANVSGWDGAMPFWRRPK